MNLLICVLKEGIAVDVYPLCILKDKKKIILLRPYRILERAFDVSIDIGKYKKIGSDRNE